MRAVRDRLIACRRNGAKQFGKKAAIVKREHPCPCAPAALWTAVSAATRPRRTSFKQRSAAMSRACKAAVAPTNTGYDVERKVPGRGLAGQSAGSRGGVLKRRIRANQILQPTGEIPQPRCVRRRRQAGDKVFELRRQGSPELQHPCGTVLQPLAGYVPPLWPGPAQTPCAIDPGRESRRTREPRRRALRHARRAIAGPPAPCQSK